MSDTLSLAPDLSNVLVSDMFAVDLEAFRVNSAKRLVELAREPGNNVLPNSPFIAGLVAASKFEPAIDADTLAESYARLSTVAEPREFNTMTGRDVARLMVSFSLATDGIHDIEHAESSENARRMKLALNWLPKGKFEGIAESVSEIVSKDMLLNQTEVLIIAHSVYMREVDEVIFVRPRSSDIAQAGALSMILDGRGDQLGVVDPDFIERNASVLVAAEAILQNEAAFERPVDDDMLVSVMANAIASREAGQSAGPPEFEAASILNTMASEIVLRHDAENLLEAYNDPSSTSDMRILDSVTHLDEDGLRFFRAVALGRFDRMEVEDMVHVRENATDAEFVPAEIAMQYPGVIERRSQILATLNRDGDVNDEFVGTEVPKVAAEQATTAQSDAQPSRVIPQGVPSLVGESQSEGVNAPALPNGLPADPVQKDAGLPSDPAKPAQDANAQAAAAARQNRGI